MKYRGQNVTPAEGLYTRSRADITSKICEHRWMLDKKIQINTGWPDRFILPEKTL